MRAVRDGSAPTCRTVPHPPSRLSARSSSCRRPGGSGSPPVKRRHCSDLCARATTSCGAGFFGHRLYASFGLSLKDQSFLESCCASRKQSLHSMPSPTLFAPIYSQLQRAQIFQAPVNTWHWHLQVGEQQLQTATAVTAEGTCRDWWRQCGNAIAAQVQLLQLRHAALNCQHLCRECPQLERHQAPP